MTWGTASLPPGWAWARLDEVAQVHLGKMLDSKRQTGLQARPYLRNINVQWDKIDRFDLLTMDIADHELERYTVLEGDLLMCEGGEPGRCAIVTSGAAGLGYQKALHRIRPEAGMDVRYIAQVFRYLAVSGLLEEHFTGSTIKHLPQERLVGIKLPVPPRGLQASIAESLAEDLSVLDAGRAAIGVAVTRLHALRGALLDAEVRQVGAKAHLRDLLDEPLINGRSVRTENGGFPVLRLTALRGGRVLLDERKDGAWTAEKAQPYIVREGDFLVSRGNGSLRLVGRGGLVGPGGDAVAFPDTMIRVRPSLDACLPAYLRLVWDCHAVRQQVESQARTTAGIYKINQQILEGLTVPLPPLPEQARIVAVMSLIDDNLAVASEGLKRVQPRGDALYRSLLTNALSGEVGCGDPSDQPAEALLDAIRQVRAGRPKRARSRATGTVRARRASTKESP